MRLPHQDGQKFVGFSLFDSRNSYSYREVFGVGGHARGGVIGQKVIEEGWADGGILWDHQPHQLKLRTMSIVVTDCLLYSTNILWCFWLLKPEKNPTNYQEQGCESEVV